MARLYVDVDDTLVLWLIDGQPADGPLPFGTGAEDWRPNTRLILEIELWCDANPEGKLIVWSGGGDTYATMWGRRLLHHLPHEAMAKDPRILMPGDIYVDDMELKSNAQRGYPDTWEH